MELKCKYLKIVMLPAEKRIKLHDEVLRLNKLGRGHTKIARTLRIWPQTVGRQIKGSDPFARRLFEARPCGELGYVMGVILGDGCLYNDGGRYAIKLAAKDFDFVEKFARCVAKLVNGENLTQYFCKRMDAIE